MHCAAKIVSGAGTATLRRSLAGSRSRRLLLHDRRGMPLVLMPMRKLPATAAVVVALGRVRLIADMVPSSRIDMLARLLRCWTRRLLT
jgi:hypothetical protein